MTMRRFPNVPAPCQTERHCADDDDDDAIARIAASGVRKKLSGDRFVEIQKIGSVPFVHGADRITNAAQELQILQDAADGKVYKQTAAELGTSAQIIKNVASALLKEFGVENKTHLVAIAIRRGTID